MFRRVVLMCGPIRATRGLAVRDRDAHAEAPGPIGGEMDPVGEDARSSRIRCTTPHRPGRDGLRRRRRARDRDREGPLRDRRPCVVEERAAENERPIGRQAGEPLQVDDSVFHDINRTIPG